MRQKSKLFQPFASFNI